MAFLEPGGEHIVLGEVPPLPVQEAEAVRALAMNEPRRLARTKRQTREQPRTHRYVLYDDSGGEVGSNLTDTLLAVSVSKKDFRHYSMRISFLELVLSDANRYSNYREIYAFDWNEKTCLAHKTNIEHLGKIVLSSCNEDGIVTDTIKPRRVQSVLPIEPADCDELCNRMLAVTAAVKNRAA